jgi:fibronectin type 3 domain-containing protein
MSSSTGGTYTVKVCVTDPVGGTTLTGGVPARATVTITAGTGTSTVARTEWTLNGTYLISDYQTPHQFTLYTNDFVDGKYTLGAAAVLRDGYRTPETTVNVTFHNGNKKAPVNTAQWTVPPIAARAPTDPFVVAAVGDGAGGEANATAVTNAMVGWNPDLFLYLGDVYSEGTLTEFRNWYGDSNSFFGRLRSVTTPVVGNHEYTANQAPGYFDYWDNIEHYYSYNANSWHFIAIDSTSNYGKVAPGTPQYEWLAADLAANRSPCTVVFWHHPLYTVGSEDPAPRMQPMWDLMAQYKVSMLLTGHDHQYQRWSPMGAGGVVNSTGITELVAGTGGHSSQGVMSTDSRVAKTNQSYGAVRMELFGNRADVNYYSTTTTTGTTLVDSSTVTCKGADGLAPAAPTGLTATESTPGTVDVSWTAAVDNLGVTGYRVYRDGTAVANLPGGATTWADKTVAKATNYTYTVDAVDAAGNRSAKSAPVSIHTYANDTTPPTAPTGLTAAVTTDAVTLSWQPSTDNIGVTGYSVLRDGAVVATVATTGYADTTVPANETHSWTVRAFDAGGNTSAESGSVSAMRDTLAPTIPDGLTATSVQAGSIGIAWNVATDNVGVTGYRVYRDGQLLATVPDTATSYTDNTVGATFGTLNYQVAAVDAAGNASAPSAPLAVTTVDGSAPTTPANLVATATEANRVALSWDPSTDDAGVTGYVIYRDGNPLATASTTAFTDATVLSETTYSYTVAARDAAGNLSSVTTPAIVTTPTPAAIAAVADTYARAASPTSNYGRATALRVDTSPTNTYLKFTVSGLTGPVARARLRVYTTAGTTPGVYARGVTDTSWTEYGMTWNNAPAINGGSPVSTSGKTVTDSWATLDVTPLITGNGTYTIALTNNGSSSSYASRETTTVPQLLLDVTG